jgi:gliding motility-associated-like protein
LHNKNSILAIILCACSLSAWSQGIINNSAKIVMNNNVHIVLTGASSDYLSTGTAVMKAENGGTFYLPGDWINNGGTSAYGSNNGSVHLSGGNQDIGGTSSTNFNALVCSGLGDKYLSVNTLCGGGFSGTKSGFIDLVDAHLWLNGNKLTINNANPNAVRVNTGGIVSETNSVAGYSSVQWNIRSAAVGYEFDFPFSSTDRVALPFTFAVKSVGVQVSDSGYIEIATYPTITTILPNNRPLPTGVGNLLNDFGVENDVKSVDRFYILDGNGFSKNPSVALHFPYLDREWNTAGGSLNKINENSLVAAKFDNGTSSWNYSYLGTTTISDNTTTSETLNNYKGAWVLHNNPYCPDSDFSFVSECFNKPITLNDRTTISEGVIDTFLWRVEGQVVANQSGFSHDFSSPGLFDVVIKSRGDRGCWDSITKKVSIFPLPTARFGARDTCYGDLTRLASNSTTPIGYPLKQFWSFDGNTSTFPIVTHQFSDTGFHTIEIIAINGFNCRDTLASNIHIEPLPTVLFDAPNLCEGERVFFVNNTTTKGIVNYWNWRINNELVGLDNTYSQRFNRNGVYKVALLAENSFGCQDSLIKNLEVYPRAAAAFTYLPKEVYISDPTVSFINTSSDANQYAWFIDDGWSPIFFTKDVNHTFQDTGAFVVSLIANNNFNCPDTLSKLIAINPDVRIFIPNAFSPYNKDDLNQSFGPAGMLHGLKEMEMNIYNRWGEKLYSTNSIDRPWDGTYKGVNVPQGNYLYMIKLKDVYDNIYWYEGTVMLLE